MKFLSVFSLLAILLSTAGMVHQHVLLNGFHIALNDYADVDDFLVASINLIHSFHVLRYDEWLLIGLLFLIGVVLMYVAYRVYQINQVSPETAQEHHSFIQSAVDRFVSKIIKKISSSLLRHGVQYFLILTSITYIAVGFLALPTTLAHEQYKHILQDEFQGCAYSIVLSNAQDDDALMNKKFILITSLNYGFFFWDADQERVLILREATVNQLVCQRTEADKSRPPALSLF